MNINEIKMSGIIVKPIHSGDTYAFTQIKCQYREKNSITIDIACFDAPVISTLRGFNEGDEITIHGQLRMKKNDYNGAETWYPQIVCDVIEVKPVASLQDAVPF